MYTRPTESPIHPRSTFADLSFVIFMPILIMTFVSAFAAVTFLIYGLHFFMDNAPALICLQLT